MFDVEVRTASAIAPMSAFSLLAKSAATRPQSVLNATALGPKNRTATTSLTSVTSSPCIVSKMLCACRP